MELLLVRHGIAADRHPQKWPRDADRPLTPEGEARFREASRGLSRIHPPVEVVLCSPYPRARRTADILAEEVGWPSPQEAPELEAERSPADALRLLSSRTGIDSLALVGHEPNLSELASFLLAGTDGGLQLEMKKGGVACLFLHGEPAPGSAILRWLATPKMLRAMAP